MRLMQYQFNRPERIIITGILLLTAVAKAQTAKPTDKADEVSCPSGWVHIGPQEPRATREVGREVQLDTSFNSDDAGRPLIEIAHAVQKDATAPRYRVSWHILFPNFQYDGTAVYDREEHSIKLYESDFDVSENGISHSLSHTFFTKVTDDLLLKLAADYEAENTIIATTPSAHCCLKLGAIPTS